MKTIHLPGRRYAPVFCSLFILFFCFTFSAYSTIYFISTTGNDISGNGTVLSPWKTLYKATTMATATGDIIHINAGTYTETAQCLLRPGVSIEGEGVTSIIRSTSTADFTAIILAASATEGTNGNQSVSNLNFDGQNLNTSIAITVKARKNFSVHHCTFSNFKFSAITMSGYISLFSEPTPPAVYAQNNAIYNNIITNCAGFTVWGGSAIYGSGSLYVVGQKDLLIHDNTIINIARPDGENGWPIKCTDYSQGMKIYNNVLTRKPFPHTTNGTNDYWDFAIEGGDVQGMEIYNNTIKGSVDLNRNTPGAYPYSIYIHDNVIGNSTLTANHECGIILEYNTEKAIIEKNTIKNCADAIVFSVRPGGHTNDITIKRNLITGVGSVGGGYGRGIGYYGGGTYSADTVNILNNTIEAATAGNAPFWGIDFAQPTTYNKLNFKNNIVKDFNYGGAVMVARNLAGFTNSFIQYNDFYNNSNANDPFPSWVESITNLSPTSVYSNTLKVNPVFVSASNYSLQATSPLVDAGVYVGMPFAGTAPDRGYAEVNLALPVKLIEFSVTENKEKNLLLWKTVTESNSDYFSVERSANGINYEAIGRVNATGFSSNIINYNFTDATPLKGINYYRLVMIDKDNSFEYSNIVTIARQAQGISILSAQVFTVKKQVNMSVASAQNKKATLAVFDVNGRQFLNERIELQKGLNTISKNITVAAKGIYYIRLYTENETQVKSTLATE